MKMYWTNRQRAIVRRIIRRYRLRNGQIRWRRALLEHPEWVSDLPKHLSLPKLARQMLKLTRKKSKEEKALRSVEAQIWINKHRRAYLNNILASPKLQKQLNRFKTHLGFSYRTVVGRAVDELYVKTFHNHKSKKGHNK